jgi:hypothetical protein
VDSWRNSNQDPRLRSRRVRRQAKLNNRNKMASQHPPTPGSAVAPPTGLPGPNNSMAAPGARGPGSMPSASQQMHHHHANPDGSAPGHENVGGKSLFPFDVSYLARGMCFRGLDGPAHSPFGLLSTSSIVWLLTSFCFQLIPIIPMLHNCIVRTPSIST